MSCNKQCTGPGYQSPIAAYRTGKREKLLYVVTVQPNLNEKHGDYLSTIDVDPDSPTYCQIIHRLYTNRVGDELHHSGWNTCSSCHRLDNFDETKGKIPVRNKLVLPCLNSNSIYIVKIDEANERTPEHFAYIDGKRLLNNLNVSAPHTAHCLPSGSIMISTMGDGKGDGKGEFILIDANNFNTIETWTQGNKTAKFGYDFWYQPYHDVMIASEWGAPRIFRRGFHPSDSNDQSIYGRSLNVYSWSKRELIQTIDLGQDGIAPLEIRFLHDPKAAEGYVGCALNANVFRFYRKEIQSENACVSYKYYAEKVIDVPAKLIKGWTGSNNTLVQGMITDILLSLDDKYLYLSNWLHGDVRQYDITDRSKPVMTGQIFLGGVLCNEGVTMIEDKELTFQPKKCKIQGRTLNGGPQMLQLSLDGKRLYVSSSLYSPWDKQFYPDMVKAGGTIVQIDIDTDNGGMALNEKFLVDFGNDPYGPGLPHEMRYPGGDCTSDIWLAEPNV